MRLTIVTLATIALVSCNQAEAPADTNAAEANVEADANTDLTATPAAFQLNETTWTFTDKDGQAVQESIDASGNYIANVGDKHLDHGTSVMKDGKACFTSAMDKEGEVCWTVQPAEIGQSVEVTSDKGEKLTVTRTAYTPMTIPAAK
jgi:hypothetical protein